jgi:hypothetical protein
MTHGCGTGKSHGPFGKFKISFTPNGPWREWPPEETLERARWLALAVLAALPLADDPGRSLPMAITLG